MKPQQHVFETRWFFVENADTDTLPKRSKTAFWWILWAERDQHLIVRLLLGTQCGPGHPMNNGTPLNHPAFS